MVVTLVVIIIITLKREKHPSVRCIVKISFRRGVKVARIFMFVKLLLHASGVTRYVSINSFESTAKNKIVISLSTGTTGIIRNIELNARYRRVQAEFSVQFLCFLVA